MKTRSMIGSIASLSLAAVAFAEPPEGDVLIDIQGGTLVTGLISEDGLTSVPGVRVFHAELGIDVANFTDEPGWQSPDGTFQPNVDVAFTINRALRKWNGTDFSTATGQMEINFGALSATTPLTDTPTPGFNLAIDGAGGLHDHPDYTLLGATTNGIFLLDISFSTSQSGIGSSQPAWILFSQGATPAEIDAAFDYATNAIPAPGAAILLASAGVLASRRRRR